MGQPPHLQQHRHSNMDSTTKKQLHTKTLTKTNTHLQTNHTPGLDYNDALGALLIHASPQITNSNIFMEPSHTIIRPCTRPYT